MTCFMTYKHTEINVNSDVFFMNESAGIGHYFQGYEFIKEIFLLYIAANFQVVIHRDT